MVTYMKLTFVQYFDLSGLHSHTTVLIRTENVNQT